ncbi:uncharacterized protein ColSpa_01012 [Colletotrichum spaethianum]|uniref:Uncharacterized protein n=1 Tax=Colletotrichum spaethianum TaxID=700344 RepID=A0AA37L344_9PEZI|nr:uncharacterized protein ColSpa_01012 [Colletotrichum spaethianum]GKT40831.1 hypothetical protein ColSpa_01012 [Colletotrichum spaethianum]
MADTTEDAPNDEATRIPSTSKRILRGKDASPRKRSRVSSEPGPINQGLPRSTRRPLADMSVNQTAPSPQASQAQPQTVKQAEMVDKLTKPVAAVSYKSGQHSTVNRAEAFKPPAPNAEAHSSAQPKHACQYAGHSCLLTNTTVLLSPCIAQQPWITENLLPLHGIQQWATNSHDWTDNPPAPKPSASSSSSTTNTQKRSLRPRRICFVEHNRKEATHAMMTHLEGNPQYTPGGRREYVEVYDWRFLEDITALEKELKGSRPLAEHSGPKRKWWVGLA